MKIYTDYISGGTLIERGEHIYLFLNNEEKEYRLHLPKSLFDWLLEHRKIIDDKIYSEKELKDLEKERQKKKLGDVFT